MKKITRAALAALACVVCAAAALFIITAANASSAGTDKVRLPIVMYHHIHSSSDRWGKYIVSPATLESDLKYLRDNGFTPVSAADLIAYVDDGVPLPEKPVMLTFDDGQESFLVYALPLLEKYDMHAVAGLVGAYCDKYTELPDPNVSYAYLSWDEAAELASSGRVDLASHTYDMHSVNGERQGCRRMRGENADAYRAVFTSDLVKNEERIISAAGQAPSCFVYPFGLACDEAREILIERGYRVLLTCNEKVNVLTGDTEDLLELGRFNRPSGKSSEDFFAKLG